MGKLFGLSFLTVVLSPAIAFAANQAAAAEPSLGNFGKFQRLPIPDNFMCFHSAPYGIGGEMRITTVILSLEDDVIDIHASIVSADCLTMRDAELDAAIVCQVKEKVREKTKAHRDALCLKQQ